MTTHDAILKRAQQGLVTFPTGTPPSVSTIKKRYYYQRKGEARRNQSPRPTASTTVRNLSLNTEQGGGVGRTTL